MTHDAPIRAGGAPLVAGHVFGVLCGVLAWQSGDPGTALVLFLIYLAGGAILS